MTKITSQEAARIFIGMRDELGSNQQTSLAGLLFGFLYADEIGALEIFPKLVEKQVGKVDPLTVRTTTYHRDMERGAQLAQLVDKWKGRKLDQGD